MENVICAFPDSSNTLNSFKSKNPKACESCIKMVDK